MSRSGPDSTLAFLLRDLREERRISQLQLADSAGVNSSVVSRAESGRPALLATWFKLFEGLGYGLVFGVKGERLRSRGLWESPDAAMAALLREKREERGISRSGLAHRAGANPSAVTRAERGRPALLATWFKLFEGLGLALVFDTEELAEELQDILSEEAERRLERRIWGRPPTGRTGREGL